MARFTGGWIKLWRKAVEGDLADNVFLWGLWNWLLYAATWKPTSILWQGKRRDIPPGTVVVGMAELAEKWDCSRNTIKKWLKYLEDSDRITLEVCTRGTLVTIRNWSVYQSREADACEPTADEVQTNCTPSANEVALSKEGKKVRREESKTLSPGFIKECLNEWKITLEHFQINRGIGERDEIRIARAVTTFGEDWVKLALQGARKQTASKTWNPRDFVSLDIYFDPKRIERLVNIGAGKESAEDIDWSKVWGTA